MEAGENGNHAQRANRLARSGVDVPARIDSMVETGNFDADGSREYAVDVTVRPAKDDAYAATTNQFIHPAASFAEGMDVTVKVDPVDEGDLILWDAG